MQNELIKIRRFLKERLQRDYTTLHGHKTDRENVRQLLQRTVELGESNSLLLIGPRGSGKTTLINAVLADLVPTADFQQNTILVHLNGNLHTDDKLALKSITVQMHLENAANGKAFGSFAENLAFLLACLKSGNKRSKSVIFILEEFDLFCAYHNQTLLYNLFDVSQSAQAPICVLGATCRLDVIELLEKRVKSRFSHRQIFLFPTADTFETYLDLFEALLSIPNEKDMKQIAERVSHLKMLNSEELVIHRNHFDPAKYKFNKKFMENWNNSIAVLIDDPKSAAMISLRSYYDTDKSESFLKTLLFRLVAQLDPDSQPHITSEQMCEVISSYTVDPRVEVLCGLSVLELCLVIAIKHHSEIYDRDPFNFEIVFARLGKFAKVSTTMQGIERAVSLKAFERLRHMEVILPISSVAGKIQKDFEMHRLALTYGQINDAVHKYQALPTEVAQWAHSSIL
ncbi:PREDICTED: origin recognition complex subunit 4 [Rhagoletis zephyria]|uniref:origin recognition complex subunit 4 n=1 Tax=Rhagoletis zephyria TaxID=28612 RepID=UPI0008119698|nr:PREDICTED: origin recognition complex subunit 4 [Rhagoletis zephyria]